MAITISLRSFGLSAFIRGEQGASVIVSGSTKSLLGAFRFVLAAFGQEYSSKAKDFGPDGIGASVTGDTDTWVLSEMSDTEFLFDGRQLLKSSDKCPVLTFSRVGIRQYNLAGSPNFPALIEMPDMALSLRPNTPAPQTGSLYYPTANGWRELLIRGADHPAAPGLVGFYLRRNEVSGLAVYAAAPIDWIDLDHAKAARILADQNTRLGYVIEPAPGGNTGCLLFESRRPQALRVGLSAGAGVRFDDQSSDLQDFTWKALETVEARLGSFTNATFRDPQVRLRKSSTAVAAGRTDALGSSLFGAGTSFDMDIQIPEDSFFDPATHRAAIVYRNAASAEPARVTADPWERFFGLSIAGLNSDRGRQEIFDVDLAEIALRPAGGNGSFEISAGGEIDALGASVVRPKTDPNDNRRVAITTDGMRVVVGEGQNAGTCLEYRSETSSLTFIDPILEVPPAGAAARYSDPAARAANGGNAYDRARFRLPEQDGKPGRLTMRIEDGKTVPVGTWIDPFRTDSKKFDMLELPGVALEIKGPSKLLRAKGIADPDSGSKFDLDVEWPSDTKKVAVFSLASLAAAWYLLPKGISENLDAFRADAEDFLDTSDVQVDFDFARMTAEQLRKFVRSRAADSLQVAYYAEAPGDQGHDMMKAFIDQNVSASLLKQRTQPPKPIKKFYVPLDVGLSVVLMDISDDPDGTGLRGYASDIMFAAADANDGAPPVRPSMLFKLGQKGVKKEADSEDRIAIDHTLLGYDEKAWKDLAAAQPGLWPRASQAKGGKPDPTDPRWVGVFLRDMPVQLVAPPQVEEGIIGRSEILKSIYRAINENMFLRYGWIGPKGAAWFATLLSPNGYDVTPSDWETYITLRLEGVSVAGAEGKPLGGEARISMQLEKIKDEEGNALRVDGTFSVAVDKADSMTRFELAVTNSSILTTNAIPGFDQVELVGLSSDFVTATMKLKLTPSSALATALPIFDANKSIEASILLNFSGEPGSDLQVSLPTDSQTNLFGRFPLTIQGVYLQIGDQGNKVLVRGRLGLGLAGLDAVGADIVLRQTKDGWDFDVYVNEIGVSLDLGSDFRMKGLLSWAPDDVPIERLRPDPDRPKRYSEPLAPDELETKGKARDFWGILMLESGGLLGNLTMLVKAGSHGERTYWVAAVETDQSIGMGSASFQQPAIVLAKNADMGQGLRKLLLDPYNDNVKGLRPTAGDLEAKRNWLTKWHASSDIGTVIAGSGYLHLADGVAESPASEDSSDDNGKKYLTALVATDSGLFRLDAQTRLLGTTMVGFGIAIDTVKKNLLATIRLPEIKFPSAENPKYVISPGTMALGISYGGSPYFLLSIGWPPLIDGSQLERDWSQSTRVYIAEMFPINTFWGGYRAMLTERGVRFGLAIRAGWTWSAEMNGADIAKASAELGVTLGGVLEFQIVFTGANLPTQVPGARQRPYPWPSRALANRNEATFHALDADLANHLIEGLRIMERAVALGIDDLEMEATVYGDIWGKGSLEFLGVTLASIEIAIRLRIQICGTLKRGITRAWGRGEIEVKVTILCVSFTGKAGFDLWLKRGPYPCLTPLRSALSAPQPLETHIDVLPQGVS